MTPEWITKEGNKAKIHQLQSTKKLSLIAIDEAHLCHYWEEFRKAYKHLENLKSEFLTTPIMALTATAPPEVLTSMLKLVQNPVIAKGSMERPNVKLSCEELSCQARGDFNEFALRVSENVGYKNLAEQKGIVSQQLLHAFIVCLTLIMQVLGLKITCTILSFVRGYLLSTPQHGDLCGLT